MTRGAELKARPTATPGVGRVPVAEAEDRPGTADGPRALRWRARDGPNGGSVTGQSSDQREGGASGGETAGEERGELRQNKESPHLRQAVKHSLSGVLRGSPARALHVPCRSACSRPSALVVIAVRVTGVLLSRVLRSACT